jgi:glycosyltransferase involved in cell wall biosynthesis
MPQVLRPGGTELRIALYGPYMFQLAAGLRQNPSNDVRLFLDEDTLPTSLAAEPLLADSTFVEIGPWGGRQAVLGPARTRVARQFEEFDVALVTELGPIFASKSETAFFFIPTGWDLTCGPFPIRSRSLRPRGFGDISAILIAARLRAGIRAASGIWGAPFSPYTIAVDRLGRVLTENLPQPIDTGVFCPENDSSGNDPSNGSITIFHPSRMMFTMHPFLVETGQWKRNDLFFRGVARAIDRGINVRLVLIERASSPDQDWAKKLIQDLGLMEHVEWVSSSNSAGFTWRELAEFYRSSDVVADEFGGWFGLVALEGASCGKPVVNYVKPDVMALMYPEGHPFIQAADEESVCEAIVRLVDQGYRSRIGHESRQWVLDHHDRRVVAKKCESILAGLGFE